MSSKCIAVENGQLLEIPNILMFQVCCALFPKNKFCDHLSRLVSFLFIVFHVAVQNFF